MELVDTILDYEFSIVRKDIEGSNPSDRTIEGKVEEGRTYISVRPHNKGEYIMIEAIEIFLSRIDFAFLDKIWTAKIKAGVANGGKGLVSQKAIHAQIHALKTFFPSNLRIQNNILMQYRARLNSQHIIHELPSETPKILGN